MQICSWRTGDLKVRAVRRPDDRWALQLPDDPTTWAQVVRSRPAQVTRVIINRPEPQPSEEQQALRAAGFRPARTEQQWRVPLAAPVGAGARWIPTTHELRSVTGCDLTRVVELDDAIRQQIPGCEGWHGTVDDLRESLADDEFDPDLYLVAVHRRSGSYDGLVRVWSRPDRPRVGCLGVR